jgi:hypothetical protein
MVKRMTNITFEPLNESHFPLLLKWLEAPHVKAWWDQDMTYTMNLVREKYSSRISSLRTEGEAIHKNNDGWIALSSAPCNDVIQGFIIHNNQNPVGYIQIYNAYDFLKCKPLSSLPENLGAFDIFIGKEEALGQGLGSTAISEFLRLYSNQYTYIFADPDSRNIAAVKCYEKAGFKKVSEQEDTGEVWMLWENILGALTAREPIFHHPEKFGITKQDIENQMCDEFWEVGASGNVYTRANVIETLLERYNDLKYQDIWEAKGFELTKIAQDNYLLTYILIQNKTRVTRRSTIWRRVNDNWKILYHQGTIIDGGKE